MGKPSRAVRYLKDDVPPCQGRRREFESRLPLHSEDVEVAQELGDGAELDGPVKRASRHGRRHGFGFTVSRVEATPRPRSAVSR